MKFPTNANPAEFMIDVVSGDLSKGRDWGEVWLKSEECTTMIREIEELKAEYRNQGEKREDDGHEYASMGVTQFRLVTKRASIQVI